MEDGVVVVASFGQLREVLARLGCMRVVELDGNSTLC